MSPALALALLVFTLGGYGLAAWLLARALRAAEPAPAGDPDDQTVEAVAQAIADCYGHGPLAVMDPAYVREFRRDARAAIAAIRGRV